MKDYAIKSAPHRHQMLLIRHMSSIWRALFNNAHRGIEFGEMTYQKHIQ